MQTRSTERLDYGIPGEFGTTNPRRVNPTVTSADVVMGGPIGRKSDGTVGPYGATYSTYLGVGVTTHQHVSYGTVEGTLAPTLTVKSGDTIGVVTMGDVYITLPLSVAPESPATTFATEAAARAAMRTVKVPAGTAVYVTSAGAYTLTSTDNTLVGYVVENRDCAGDELADSDITMTMSSTDIVGATASLTVMVRIG